MDFVLGSARFVGERTVEIQLNDGGTRRVCVRHVVINTGASVDHDCCIGNGAQLGPGVVLGGRVKIGDLTFIGLGASVINQIEIGRNCVVGAGAVVVRDIPDHSLAYGVPSRVVGQRKPK